MTLMLLALAVLAGEPAAAALQGSQKPATNSSLLQIVAVDVSLAGRKTAAAGPPQATPDTLYQLRVRIGNKGSEPASNLSFQVTLNGQRLAVYVNHLYRTDLAPGKETEVRLYNFWSSETGRPFPADGRLVVEVRLTGARWMGAGDKKATDVQPLPAPVTVTLSSRKTS